MLDFIVSNLPLVICAVAGMALIVLEIFIPGFGVPGISGILLLLVSVGFTLFNYGTQAALGMTIVIIAVLAIVAAVALRSAARGSLSRSRLVLNDAITDEESEIQLADLQTYVGRTGEAFTILRPVGVAQFDGERLDVVTEGEFIEKGQPVVVSRVDGRRVIVQKA
ncbi:MAG: hypothetical protein FWD25_05860 [Clostridia bacterium]|nr:hypothetical protein [Clostridia bacterium]